MKSRVTDFDLEQFVLGELSLEKKEWIEMQILQSEELQKKVAQIKISNREVLEDMPAHLFNTQVKSKVDRKALERPLIQGRWVQWASLICILLVAGVMFPFNQEENKMGAPGVWVSSFSSERIKGEEVGMMIYKKKSNEVLLLSDSSKVKAGDLLQITIKHLTSLYVVVFSLDGNGVVTRHFPVEGEHGFIEGQGLFTLPYSYELDNAPRFEKFFMVSSGHPIDVDSVISGVQNKTINGYDEMTLLKEEGEQ